MEMISYKLASFEGPLDLLLTLISKNKLDIYDIQIFELVEQYMDYIKSVSAEDLDVASEFLEMAARLVHIKSVSLLPKHEEAEALKEELQGELIEYQECKRIAAILANMADYNTFVREPATVDVDMTYRRKHNPVDMFSSYVMALGKKNIKLPPSEEAFYGIVKKKVVSVSSKIIFVLRSSWRTKSVKYKSLFQKSNDTSELVATFLAVLELVRGKRMRIEGSDDNLTLKLVDGGETKNDK